MHNLYFEFPNEMYRYDCYTIIIRYLYLFIIILLMKFNKVIRINEHGEIKL